MVRTVPLHVLPFRPHKEDHLGTHLHTDRMQPWEVRALGFDDTPLIS